MTTDLTGDFELGEDEFDWDVFLPDPDQADMEAEAASLEGEAELSLDDSDFDWDGALRDDTGPDGAADDARAGAAYDRIVDTVRRSVEDEPPTRADDSTHDDGQTHTDVQHEADTIPAFGVVDDSELRRDTDGELGVTAFTTSFADAPGSDADAHGVAAWTPTAQLEPRHEPGLAIDREPQATWTTWKTEPEPEREPVAAFVREPDLDTEPRSDLEEEMGFEPEVDQWLALDEGPLLAGTGTEQTVAFESAQTPEPEAPPFAGAAATVASIGAVESAPLPSTDDNAAWAMAPDQPWEVDEPAESLSHARTAGTPEDGAEKPKRSLIFKATVVLAVLFLVAAAAVLAVRGLHHPTTTAAPAHVTTPTQAAVGTKASGPSSTGTAASGAARIQAATDAVDSATTAASVGLTSLSAFPTPTNVETVINPYVSSLQLYETFLSGTKVPASAQPAATSAVARIRQDLQFLETIDGLPPAQLGAFLVQFDTDATQLQTTLSALEQDLRTPSS
jgi:hypothetical protein